jgi:NCS1 family nucleobase:cation symporter-1
LGPIAGIFIVDYYLIRKQKLSLHDLYRRGGAYEYSRGFNWKAVGALAAGILAALVGLVFSDLRALYDYAWFVGFGVAAIVYSIAMGGVPQLDLSNVPMSEKTTEDEK